MPNINEYLQAIGVQVDQERNIADLTLLQKIVAGHLRKFPYQNTELFVAGQKEIAQRKPSSLTPDFLFEKLITKNSPGYCFQNSELLIWALKSIGFIISRHLVKLVNQSSEKLDSKSVDNDEYAHECIIVDLQDEKWLVDAAYANNSLRQPVKITPAEQQIDNEIYRLTFRKNDFYLEIQTPQGWFCLYNVEIAPKSTEQINAAHQNLVLSPKHFPIRDDFLKLGIVTEGKRKALVMFKETNQGFFKSYKGSGCKAKKIGSMKEFKDVASQKFHIAIEDEAMSLFP